MKKKDPLFLLFLNTIKSHRLIHPGASVLVGVSGGQDSTALLDLLARIQKKFSLKLAVAHLNHSLRPSAGQEEERVRSLAEQYGLPFYSRKIDAAALARARKDSLENVAREERRKFFLEISKKWGANKVALGHTADDQAETVLMRLMRGAGNRGLSGMSCRSTLENKVELIRPLLEFSRKDTEDYCREHQLSYCADETNEDPAYLRNWTRHRLIPLLQEKNPSIRLMLNRLALNLEEETLALDWLTKQALSDIRLVPGPHEVAFDRALFCRYPAAVGKRMLESLMRQYFCSDLSFSRAEAVQLLNLIESGQGEKKVSVSDDYELILQYERGIIRRKEVPQKGLQVSAMEYVLKVPGQVALKGFSSVANAEILENSPVIREETLSSNSYCLLPADMAQEGLVIRTRREGDHLYGRKRTLKEFFIRKKIPASRRDSVMILANSRGEVLWIPGIFQAFAPEQLVQNSRILSIHLGSVKTKA